MSEQHGGAGAVVSSPQENNEELSAATDPYWDELTDEVLGHLRQVRAAARRQVGRDRLFRTYVILLFLGIYGGVYGAYALRQGAFSTSGQPDAAWATSVPCAAMATAALVLLTLLRSARWRGPVVLDPLTVTWLLPLPVRWPRLLLPRYRSALVRAVLTGAAAGACAGLGLCLAGAGALLPDVFATAAAAAALAALATGCSGVATSRPAVTRWWPVLLGLVAALGGAQALCAWYGYRFSTVEAVELWSGPWGWAAQIVSTATGAATGWQSWPLAAALLLAAATAAAHWAAPLVPSLSGEGLRARSRTARGVANAVGTADLRQARLAIRADTGTGPAIRWRPRPPRLRFLLIPWRDALAHLAAPTQPAWGLAWWLGGLLFAASAHAASGTAATSGAAASALGCGYMAAAQWVEPARTDADDLRRWRLLPYRYPALVLRHAAVPTAALAATGTLGCALAAVAGRPVAPLVGMLAAIPALVAAALVSANRGSMPASLFIGSETAWGNTAPLQVLLWHTRAPLAVCALLTPGIAAMTQGMTVLLPGALTAVTTVVSFCWAWGRARRLSR